MKYDTIKKLFQESEGEMIIESETRRKAMETLREVIAKKKLFLNNKALLMLRRISYMDKKLPVIHFVGNLFVLLLLSASKGIWKNETSVYLAAMISAIILGVLSTVVFGSIFSGRLAELPESCYFNVRQIVAGDMVLSGGFNLAFFLVLIPAVSSVWQTGLFRFGIYLLVPYVFSQTCCLLLLLTETGRAKPVFLLFAGAFLILLSMIAASFPEIYAASAFVYWLYAFIIGVFFLTLSICHLFHAIDKGEMICMN